MHVHVAAAATAAAAVAVAAAAAAATAVAAAAAAAAAASAAATAAAATAAAAANQANGAAGAKTPPWSEKFAFAFYSNGKRRRIRRDNEIGKARAGQLQQLVELSDDHTLEEPDCINLEAFISIGAQLRLRLSEQQGELPATFEADAAKYFDEACNEPHGE